MLFRGTLIGPASGKLNGVVASHNRGGQYFRTHIIPTDPATARQLNMRSALADTYALWTGFTVQERQDWQNWASSRRRTNRLGDATSLTGWQEFARYASQRIQVNEELAYGLAIGGLAPRITEAALSEQPVGSIITSGTVFRLSFLNPDWWVHDGENALCLYLGSTRTGPGTRAVRAKAATINWFRGPYQLVAAQAGDQDDPIPSVIDYTLPIAAAINERVFWRARLTTEDSGLSRAYEGVAIRSV